jgi:3-dehydroquinate dehydratase-1
MRPQSKVRITIKGRIIGGPRPLICLPLMAGDRTALMEQAATIASLKPDMIEWRADAFDRVTDTASAGQALRTLHARCQALPLIFTCRAAAEGGRQALAPETRLALYQMAIRSGQVDLIDIELSSGDATIQTLRPMCRSAGVKLVLSYHNFDLTPGRDVLRRKLQQAEKAGADIAQIAVMAQDGHDVLTLLQAAWEARSRYLTIPLIAIAMGAQGAITRIAGGQFGSDITFARGLKSSAPGQPGIEALRMAWSLLPWQNEPSA